MITKKLYTCQFCNTDYADKEKAMECEKNHKVLETATIIGDYKSLKSIPDGCPTKINGLSIKGTKKTSFHAKLRKEKI